MSVTINLTTGYGASGEEIYPGNTFTPHAYQYNGAPGPKNPTIDDHGSSVRFSLSNTYRAEVQGYLNGSGIAVTPVLDLSGCSTVTVEYSGYSADNGGSEAIFYLSTSENSYDSTKPHANAVSGGTKVTLDISGMSDRSNCYFGVLLYAIGGYSSTTAVTVTSVTAE